MAVTVGNQALPLGVSLHRDFGLVASQRALDSATAAMGIWTEVLSQSIPSTWKGTVLSPGHWTPDIAGCMFSPEFHLH